ncbi:MAG: PKD domain-containing protein [Nanoarchaeota archaeon]|nr:PKD domain-containing protein [Nanoarchaeota archaeon]
MKNKILTGFFCMCLMLFATIGTAAADTAGVYFVPQAGSTTMGTDTTIELWFTSSDGSQAAEFEIDHNQAIVDITSWVVEDTAWMLEAVNRLDGDTIKYTAAINVLPAGDTKIATLTMHPEAVGTSDLQFNVIEILDSTGAALDLITEVTATDGTFEVTSPGPGVTVHLRVEGASGTVFDDEVYVEAPYTWTDPVTGDSGTWTTNVAGIAIEKLRNEPIFVESGEGTWGYFLDQIACDRNQAWPGDSWTFYLNDAPASWGLGSQVVVDGDEIVMGFGEFANEFTSLNGVPAAAEDGIAFTVTSKYGYQDAMWVWHSDELLTEADVYVDGILYGVTDAVTGELDITLSTAGTHSIYVDDSATLETMKSEVYEVTVSDMPAIEVRPSEKIAYQGQTFTVDVDVIPGGEDAKAVQFELGFDEDVLEVKSMTVGSFFGGNTVFTAVNTYSNIDGTVEYGASITDTGFVSSAGTVITLEFEVIGDLADTSALDIHDSIVTNNDPTPADINAEEIDGNVVVAGNCGPNAVAFGEHDGVTVIKSYPVINNVNHKAYMTGRYSNDPEGQGLSYSWDFGDSSSKATGVEAEHKYTAPNTAGYTATLTVTDSQGLDDSTTLTVVVCKAGDTNIDDSIDIVDAALIGQRWGKTASGYDSSDAYTYDTGADLTNDGSIDIVDIGEVGFYWS